jgi:hypothetical protein
MAADQERFGRESRESTRINTREKGEAGVPSTPDFGAQGWEADLRAERSPTGARTSSGLPRHRSGLERSDKIKDPRSQRKSAAFARFLSIP